MIYSIESISKSIRIARKKKRLSQRALGLKVGIPQSHISKIEHGLVDLQLSSLIEIARALDLEVVLISRSSISLVQAIEAASASPEPLPAYRLEDGGDEDV